MKNEERRILAREKLFDTISLHKTPQGGPMHHKYAEHTASTSRKFLSHPLLRKEK
ncbi:MAG: hypothetical protein IKQ07_02790 [Bacteroidaceae bacterium]|nr:hypothetical protein [Bacteroidaceae bacterium]